ncbi:MAG: hypothetical protein WAO00_05675 [Chthoniobacterales bacterium]
MHRGLRLSASVFRSGPKGQALSSGHRIRIIRPLAIATQQAIEFVGLPEGRISARSFAIRDPQLSILVPNSLARATAYMCRAPRSSEAYEALGSATEEIESEQTERVPERLKNKHFPVNPEG